MAANILSKFLLFYFISYKFASSQLICWRCDPCPNPHDNSSAFVTAVTCTSSQASCVKNTVRLFNGPPQISKGCVSSCTSNSLNFFSQGAFVDCCKSNYCNSSMRNQFSFLFILLCTTSFFLLH